MSKMNPLEDSEPKRLFLKKYCSSIIFILSVLLLLFSKRVSVLINISVEYVIGIISTILVISLVIILYDFLRAKKNTILLYNSEFGELDINTFFNIRVKKELEKKYGSKSLSFLINPLDRMFQGLEFDEELFTKELVTLKDKFISKYTKEYDYIHYYENLLYLEQKIKNQIERLIKNANLNLIIAISTAIIGILIISTSILLQEKGYANIVEVVSYYIPRLSTMIIIEFISFFFLKLYKSNLEDIKYFQNEITNLDFKLASFKAALISKDPELLKIVADTFTKTDRNAVINKNNVDESSNQTVLTDINSVLQKILKLISEK